MQSKYVSLIIPVYNEKKRLKSGLTAIVKYLRRQKYSWEILLVDDGSDLPVETGRFPVRVYRLPENMGKGAAIRFGVSKARGKYIVFTDVDLSVSITKLNEVLDVLKKHPVVIASRRLSTSHISVHQGSFREVSGRIFTGLSNIICRTDVADVTCGFKGYQKRAAQRLYSASRVNRWVFDTEVVFLARKFGIPVTQIPVVWEHREGSKVKSTDSIRSLLDLFAIRIYDWQGLYE
jgi:dolichyl-phosphate beta-glucosyltransferase